MQIIFTYLFGFIWMIGVMHFAQAENTPPVPLCRANEGLQLVNLPNPKFLEIETILAQCDVKTPNDVQVLLLHGLVARKKGMLQKNYKSAIAWLVKAKEAAAPLNFVPAAELGVTYEWATQFNKAKLIYDQLLLKDSGSRPALLGSARVALAQHRLKSATLIYQTFLQKNPADIDALNGLAWVELSDKKYAAAKKNFEKVLIINPGNKDAIIGLTNLKAAIKAKSKIKANAAIITPQTPPLALCQVNEGLRLLNLPNPPLSTIQTILALCDQETPNDAQVLLLHGLLAQKQGNCYQPFHYSPVRWLSRAREAKAPNLCAISWLQKAESVAAANNFNPTLELALIYEKANQFDRAKLIYNQILLKDPSLRPALLGSARIARAQYRLKDATAIYQALLQQNPTDVDALNGMAWIKLTKKKYSAAKNTFEDVLAKNPGNQEALTGLALLDKSTRYTLDVLGGRINVGSMDSYTAHVNLFADLNATDQVLVLLEHNTEQIGANFFTNPTLLPNNAAFLGFQRQIPDQYGWGVSYEYRQRNGLTLEQRLAVNANVFVLPRLQVFGGIREGFPFPWNNQLYSSGFTLYTDMPWNISLTGFWGHEQLGGDSSAYSFDLSKEYYHAFYDVGTAYSPTTSSWQVHGRVILPILKNQSAIANYEHYFFNNSTYFTVGWRLYWK
ncbi:hypothetical protein BH10PSE19_BH10PSE19_05600 [soil metagenome]